MLLWTWQREKLKIIRENGNERVWGYGVLECLSLELIARGFDLRIDWTAFKSPDLAAAWRSTSPPPAAALGPLPILSFRPLSLDLLLLCRSFRNSFLTCLLANDKFSFKKQIEWITIWASRNFFNLLGIKLNLKILIINYNILLKDFNY